MIELGDIVRINKLLSNLGICSRKEAARYIEDGRVKVNGILSIPGQWVEESDEILIDDEPVSAREKIYIALNKPVGITCTAEKTVKGNIIEYMNYPEYIFPVGRLDKPSEGLILLTNEGSIVNKILRAENKHEKEYKVTVNKNITQEFINKMSNGVRIFNPVTNKYVTTNKCLVTKVNNRTFKIVLTQGLNRQIRRMCEVFGYSVEKLQRVRIMNLTLKGIPYGKWRVLSKSEVSELIK